MMGTAKYLSPEQVRGKKLDGRADLYALGLVLYECLAGRVPFLGETDADTALGAPAARSHRSRPPAADAALRLGVADPRAARAQPRRPPGDRRRAARTAGAHRQRRRRPHHHHHAAARHHHAAGVPRHAASATAPATPTRSRHAGDDRVVERRRHADAPVHVAGPDPSARRHPQHAAARRRHVRSTRRRRPPAIAHPPVVCHAAFRPTVPAEPHTVDRRPRPVGASPRSWRRSCCRDGGSSGQSPDATTRAHRSAPTSARPPAPSGPIAIAGIVSYDPGDPNGGTETTGGGRLRDRRRPDDRSGRPVATTTSIFNGKPGVGLVVELSAPSDRHRRRSPSTVLRTRSTCTPATPRRCPRRSAAGAHTVRAERASPARPARSTATIDTPARFVLVSMIEAGPTTTARTNFPYRGAHRRDQLLAELTRELARREPIATIRDDESGHTPAPDDHALVAAAQPAIDPASISCFDATTTASSRSAAASPATTPTPPTPRRRR